jgi:hypothetical protein
MNTTQTVIFRTENLSVVHIWYKVGKITCVLPVSTREKI